MRKQRESGGKQSSQLERGLKVPRQCPLVLLLEVHLKEGKASGREKV
jgi:hypothetical protein